ncbi:hypothetical protein MAPG_09446 [Magnaporthiopsis poae ATCC 64411]|uniref:Hydrophobin n=1 Tax=Magnaporthiopsis poae (strain ATCC 64411 / 73-15) TaxID=644358 RepID=A0A0C4E9Z4_MAGP6|nr:hypothetical protein MAPG_09446 [Magnaporthiopsis poae ATCC 64411]
MKLQNLPLSALVFAVVAPGTLAAFSCAEGTRARCCDNILQRMGGRIVIADGCNPATLDPSAGVPGAYTCGSNKVEFCNMLSLPTDTLLPLAASYLGYTRCSHNITVGTFSSCGLGPVSVVQS